MKLTKQDFELALPVGISAHDEVYEAVSPAIATALDNYCSMLLGDVGIKRVTESEEDSQLKRYFNMLVCIDGFLSVFRQLDLVLTPTGFGIVSNDTISPASKQRVDALEGSLRTALCRARAMTVHLLRSAEWGGTAAARNFIRYIFTEHYFFFNPQATASLSYQDWLNMQPAIVDTDEQLRLRFGDEQVDDLLDAYRCSYHDRLTPYASVLQLCCDFTSRWSTMGKSALATPQYRRLVREIESDSTTYALYHGSEAYKAAHVEPFANTKESSAFVFNA